MKYNNIVKCYNRTNQGMVENHAKLLALIEQNPGLSAAKIAALQPGTHTHTVATVMLKAGLECPSNPICATKARRIVAYAKAHPDKSMRDISVACKCSDRTVPLVLKDAGIGRVRYKLGSAGSYSRWTGPNTSSKHRLHHRFVGKLLMTQRFEAYVDLNAGPGIYTPANSNCELESVCSGFWVARKFAGSVPVYLWESGDTESADLKNRLDKVSAEFNKEFGYQPPTTLFRESNGSVLPRLKKAVKANTSMLVYGDPPGRAEEDLQRMLDIVKAFPRSTILHHGYLSPWYRPKHVDRTPLKRFFKALGASRVNCQISSMRGVMQYFFVLATDRPFVDPDLYSFNSTRGQELIQHVLGN